MKCKKNIVRILCIVAVFVISLGTIWSFTWNLQNSLTQETYRTLSEVCVDYNKAFLDRISANIKTLKVFAVGLKALEQPTEQVVDELLENVVVAGGFTQMVVCDSKGRSFSTKGKFGNVANQEYFQKAMQGKTYISQPLKTASINGEESIIIAVPIQNQQEISGVLLGVYPLVTAGSQLLDFNYYSEGYGFIVAPDGTIVISGNHVDKLAYEANMFTFLGKTQFVDFSLAELKTAMKNGESKSFAFTYNGQRRFVSLTPTTVNDWYTFSISSDSVMLQQEKGTNQIVLQLMLGLGLAALVLCAWIVLGNHRHNKEIRIVNRKYQSLLDHINGGMIVAEHAVTAEETIVTYVSPGFTDMTGYTLKDIQTLYNGCYLDVIFAEDRQPVFAKYLEQLAVGNTYCMPYRIQKKDGSLIWVMDNGYLVEAEEGLRNHSIITDITAVKAQEDELRMSENRFSVAINASSGTLFEVDLKKQLYTHFENSQRIFGVDAEELLRETAVFSTLPYAEFVDGITKFFFHPDDFEVAKSAMAELSATGIASYEARLHRFDDSYIWARIDLSLCLDEFGKPSRLVGFMSDIDDVKKQAELLANKIQIDPMTGLYNKIAMATLANKILRELPDGRHALIVLDIDNFKGINDTLGHAFGDLVLIEVCTKLKNMFRSNDVVGRMGGDEFAILMKNVPDTSNVLKKAMELSAAFRQTYVGDKKEYNISCSVGILMIDQNLSNAESFETLYRKADAALYQAKQLGKDQFVLYKEADAASYPIATDKTNDEELQNLKPSHDVTAHIFELLYTSKDFNISINMALAAIGQEYQVGRVAIFENNDMDETNPTNQTTSNIYEWCNDGISSKKASLQNVPLVSKGESILDCFDENGLFYCNDVRELPPYMRQILESKGVVSTLKVLISNEEKICGFIGFDECKKYRIWTSAEIEKLSFLARVLSVFLFKKKTEVALLENLQTRLKILDALPDYICVVNPETHSLEYTNRRMRELLPQAVPGAFCFMTLRGGQAAPCETCLIERIKRGDTDNLEIISEDGSLHLQINAISINWTNDKKMVLLYGMRQS